MSMRYASAAYPIQLVGHGILLVRQQNHMLNAVGGLKGSNIIHRCNLVRLYISPLPYHYKFECGPSTPDRVQSKEAMHQSQSTGTVIDPTYLIGSEMGKCETETRLPDLRGQVRCTTVDRQITEQSNANHMSTPAV